MAEISAVGRPGAQALRRAARVVSDRALNLLLPPHCPTCDTIVAVQGGFCTSCFQRAPFIAEPCCERCGSPFVAVATPMERPVCAGCRDRGPAWRSARAAFVYDAFSRSLILPLKYGDRTENARILASHMARAGARLIESAQVIVPVPLHRWRLFSRRYNQSALIAYQLARLNQRDVVVDALIRPRATISLATQGEVDRRRTMQSAIEINPRRVADVSGRAVLLVDDVLTTGATADACATVLLAAGARSVDLLVGARTLPHEDSDAA